MPHYSDTLLHMPMHQQPTHNTPGRAVPLYLDTGTVYRFPKAGDRVPWHTHEADGSEHLVVVTRGTILFATDDGECVVLEAGSHYHVPLNVRHMLTAEVDDSECSNIQVKTLTATLTAPPARPRQPWYKRIFR